jgi:hypothetical protein
MRAPGLPPVALAVTSNRRPERLYDTRGPAAPYFAPLAAALRVREGGSWREGGMAPGGRPDRGAPRGGAPRLRRAPAPCGRPCSPGLCASAWRSPPQSQLVLLPVDGGRDYRQLRGAALRGGGQEAEGAAGPAASQPAASQQPGPARGAQGGARGGRAGAAEPQPLAASPRAAPPTPAAAAGGPVAGGAGAWLWGPGADAALRAQWRAHVAAVAAAGGGGEGPRELRTAYGRTLRLPRCAGEAGGPCSPAPAAGTSRCCCPWPLWRPLPGHPMRRGLIPPALLPRSVRHV